MEFDLIDLLKKNDVVKEGHFKLSSGRHSKLYINKDDIYSNNELFGVVCNMITKLISTKFKDDFDIITGPAIAGAILAGPVSLILRKNFVYPEKKMEIYKEPYSCHGELHFRDKISSMGMEFRRGYDKKIINSRVLIVEDIITTGQSVNQTIDAIKECGGTPIGIVSIWNRTGWNTTVCSNYQLINEYVESWNMAECPMCNDKIPLTDPKTGKEII